MEVEIARDTEVRFVHVGHDSHEDVALTDAAVELVREQAHRREAEAVTVSVRVEDGREDDTDLTAFKVCLRHLDFVFELDAKLLGDVTGEVLVGVEQ